MASEIISFRLSGEALEALKAEITGGESINTCAQRIVLEYLGLTKSTVSIQPVDKLRELITDEVKNQLSELVTRLEKLESIQTVDTVSNAGKKRNSKRKSTGVDSSEIPANIEVG